MLCVVAAICTVMLCIFSSVSMEVCMSLACSGLRSRRQGVRRLAGFWGHCWQSAVFPSGKAFGYIAYPPRPDGEPTFNEGYLFTGEGALIPARAVQAPWLTRLH